MNLEATSPLCERLRNMIPGDLISEDGLQLLCSLLKLNPEKRLSIEELGQAGDVEW